MEDKKVFVIINSYFIGDMLLVNPLIQNIKRIYKDSVVVMLTSPQLYDVAKYQEGVDDVIIWDRHGKHKGFWGMMKFIFNFPYKKIYAAFPIYSTDRPIILAKLLGAKYILGNKLNFVGNLLKSKYKITPIGKKIQSSNIGLLSGISKDELIDCPMIYNTPENQSVTVNEIKNSDYIVINAKSSKITKDITNEKVCEIIEKYQGKIVLIGYGEEAEKLSSVIEQRQYKNVTNLIGKTSIIESAQVIKHAKGCISVDTGMLHMACALNKPVVGIFYTDYLSHFEPDEKIYPLSKCLHNDNTEEIIKTLNLLLNK